METPPPSALPFPPRTRRFRSSQDPPGRADHPDATPFRPSRGVEYLFEQNERLYTRLDASLSESLCRLTRLVPAYLSKTHQSYLEAVLQTLKKNAIFDNALIEAYRKIRDTAWQPYVQALIQGLKKSGEKLDEISGIDQKLREYIQHFPDETMDLNGVDIRDFPWRIRDFPWLIAAMWDAGELWRLDCRSFQHPALPGDEEYVSAWEQAVHDAGVKNFF